MANSGAPSELDAARSSEYRTWARPGAIRVELCGAEPGKLSGAALYNRLFEQAREAESITLEHSAGPLAETDALAAIQLARGTGASVEFVTSRFHALTREEIGSLAGSGLSGITAELHTLDPSVFPALHGGGELGRMRDNLAYFRNCQEAAGRELPVLNLSFRAGEANSDRLLSVAECAWALKIYTIFVRAGVECGAALRARVNREVEGARARWPKVQFVVDADFLEIPAALSAEPAPHPDLLPRAARIFSCARSPWETLTVRAGGLVVACERLELRALGHLGEASLQEIWNSESFREFRRGHQAGEVAECSRCPWKLAYLPGALDGAILPGTKSQTQLVRGWYPADGGLAWARARAAAVLSAYNNPTHVRLEGYLPPGSNGLNALSVECAGRRLGEVTNTGGDALHFTVELSLGSARRSDGGELFFEFHTRETWLPAEGGATDRRRLGFALMSLRAQWRSETERTERAAPGPPGSRLSVLPLYAALRLARAVEPVGKWLRRKQAAPLDWGRGLSIVVPERATPELLGGCLSAAFAAAEATGEPFEIFVSVNGSGLGAYAHSMAQFPDVRWLCEERPLGYAGAIRRALSQARFGGVYLLNSDMTLDRQALAVALGWRGPLVAAVASQIVFEDDSKRREETGWPGARVRARRLEMFDAEPEDPDAARSALYASGGSALIHRELLRKWLGQFDPYHPFYWEDADWGMRAWRAGYQIVFCPRSLATHGHRATIAKLYLPEEIQRIFDRNAWLFALRHGFDRAPARRIALETRFSDPETRREIAEPETGLVAFEMPMGSGERARAAATRRANRRGIRSEAVPPRPSAHVDGDAVRHLAAHPRRRATHRGGAEDAGRDI